MTKAQQQQQDVAVRHILEFTAGQPLATICAAFVAVIEQRPDIDPATLTDLSNHLGRLADEADRQQRRAAA